MLLLLPRPVLLLSQNLGAVPSPCGQRLPWGRPARDSSPSTPRILPQQVGTGLSDRRAQERENPAVFPKHKPWMARSRMHAVTQASRLGTSRDNGAHSGHSEGPGPLPAAPGQCASLSSQVMSDDAWKSLVPSGWAAGRHPAIGQNRVH